MTHEQSNNNFIKFESFFKKYYQELTSIAYNYLKDKDDCKDIVQEVFIKVWEKKKDLIDDPKAIYYLVTAVKNNCISKLRKKVYHLSVEDATIQNEIRADIYNEESAEIQFSTHEFITTALEKLPPKCATIFKLSRFDSMTYLDIAKKLDISVKTVENQMGKAIKIMRNYIKENPLPLTMFLSLLFIL